MCGYKIHLMCYKYNLISDLKTSFGVTRHSQETGLALSIVAWHYANRITILSIHFLHPIFLSPLY